MKNLKEKEDYFYITFMKAKKSKQYRCRIQHNGKRFIEYFNSKDEALAYKEKLSHERGAHYKKGDIQYHSLFYLFNEWLDSKSLEWQSSTAVNRKNVFMRVFSELGKKWFNQITEDDCLAILKKEKKHIHNHKYYVAFQTLDEINKYCLNKYKYSLDWGISLFRKKIKIIKGSKKKPREYHTQDEIKSIVNFLSAKDCPVKHREFLYHVYRVGVTLGCRVGELCSLKKANFNPVEKTLIINSTISVCGENVLKDSSLTKTKDSRVIQVSDSAVESLLWLMKKSKTKFIIPNNGFAHFDFVKPSFLNSAFKLVLKKLKIIWIGTHGMFRKTFATQIALISKKGHRDMIASIQAHLGHKSPQMTLHYIQAVQTGLTDEMATFNLIIN